VSQSMHAAMILARRAPRLSLILMRPFQDHSGLPAAERMRLAAALGELATLGEVVRWGLLQSPPRLVSDVVKQDEFTLDVILPYGERYLVFDTT
jgi:hypothetical protein